MTEQTQTQNQDPGKSQPGGSARSFTQDELDALFAERASRAKSGALTELFGKLGVKDNAELEAILKSAREAEERQKTAFEKTADQLKQLQQRAEEAERKANELTEALQTMKIRSAVLEKARGAGFRSEALEDVWLVVDKSKLSVSEDGAVKGVDEAVEATVKARPFWLAEKGDGNSKGTPPGKKKPEAPKVDQSQKRPTLRL